MKALIIVVALLVVGYLSLQCGTIWRNKDSLSHRIEYWLEFVDENSFDQVKAGIVADAKKFDLTVDPANIHITYTDVDRAVGPEKFVSKLADFKNKQVVIHVIYVDRLVGLKWSEDITHGKIKVIEVREKVRPEVEELLK